VAGSGKHVMSGIGNRASHERVHAVEESQHGMDRSDSVRSCCLLRRHRRYGF
jgi:hypothetical protein